MRLLPFQPQKESATVGPNVEVSQGLFSVKVEEEKRLQLKGRALFGTRRVEASDLPSSTVTLTMILTLSMYGEPKGRFRFRTAS